VITFASYEAISIGPGEALRINTTMRHSQYFSQTRPGQWVHHGRLLFLDYAGFKGRSLVQRITKEYWIPRSMLMLGGRAFHVLGSPGFDWTTRRQGIRVWQVFRARRLASQRADGERLTDARPLQPVADTHHVAGAAWSKPRLASGCQPDRVHAEVVMGGANPFAPPTSASGRPRRPRARRWIVGLLETDQVRRYGARAGSMAAP
jgi:hypothetical protein